MQYDRQRRSFVDPNRASERYALGPLALTVEIKPPQKPKRKPMVFLRMTLIRVRTVGHRDPTGDHQEMRALRPIACLVLRTPGLVAKARSVGMDSISSDVDPHDWEHTHDSNASAHVSRVVSE